MPASRASRSFASPAAVLCLAVTVLAGPLVISSLLPGAPRPAGSAARQAFSPASTAPPIHPTADPSPRQAPSPAPSPAAVPKLADVLAKAAEYCRKLESSAFDFVCREEIKETIDPKLDSKAVGAARDPGSTIYLPPGAPAYFGPTLVISTVNKIKRSFVYDYQCIRAGRTIRELRTQLEENGKKKVRANAELQTSVIVFGTALLGPVGLFGERFQPDYSFTFAGKDKVGKVEVIVLDAEPKPGTPPTRNLYGQAWVDPATGNILKIEWSESRVGHFDVFQKRGEKFERTPRLTILSEFSAEKNGIRFPSHLSVEEAYLNDKGKVFIRSKTDVTYKDFKFFSVEYEIRN
jgi:hypothetical protein